MLQLSVAHYLQILLRIVDSQTVRLISSKYLFDSVRLGGPCGNIEF